MQALRRAGAWIGLLAILAVVLLGLLSVAREVGVILDQIGGQLP